MKFIFHGRDTNGVTMAQSTSSSDIRDLPGHSFQPVSFHISFTFVWKKQQLYGELFNRHDFIVGNG